MQRNGAIGRKEFIALMALLMSVIAMAIDAMLPALGEIGRDLGVASANDTQLIVSFVFLGMGPGLLFYGPFSDARGRRPAIYLGLSIFLAGSLLSMLAPRFDVMLAGRLLQGFGGACSRVVTMSMIRDRFSGQDMGRVMSLIMIVFILVPALAPALGQGILIGAHWRGIFAMFVLSGMTGMIWLHFRQEETLAPEKRIPLSFRSLRLGAAETIRNRAARHYTIASGLVFGAFVGYLSTSRQILQVQYELGDYFVLVFGFLALGIGTASWANARLLLRFTMERISVAALLVMVAAAAAFAARITFTGQEPEMILLIGWLLITLFCFGLLFANFSTLAVDPLGHIAGIANSVISSVQTLISVLIGGLVGQAYAGSVMPLVLAFLLCCSLALAITLRTIRPPG